MSISPFSSHSSDRDQVGTTLSRLARTCRQSEAALRRAADLSTIDSLGQVLDRAARERARFAHELELEAHVLGGLVPQSGSGARLRYGGDAEASDAQRVEVCHEGEQIALAEYERALRVALPVELERLLRGHHAAIREGLERLAQIVRAMG